MLLTFALLISQNILSLLLPYQNSLKTHINEMLDLDLIKQQADHGILDISKLAQSIVGFLSKMCAPARDEQAKKILLNEDIVDLFRWADKKLEIWINKRHEFELEPVLLFPIFIQGSV